MSVIIPPLPFPIVNGTLADAAVLMANLNWIINNVNANAAGGASGLGSKNVLANGAMQVNQRLASATPITLAATHAYTLDRWEGKTGAGQSADYSQVVLAVGDLEGAEYALKVIRAPLNVAVTPIQLAQSLETTDSYPLQGQDVTLSFYARKGANYSGSGNELTATLISGTGTDQNVLSGFTGAATVVTDDVVLTAGFVRYQISGTVAAAATQLGVVFTFTPTGTAGADDSFDITNVQLELAPAATPFDALTYASQLARCMRYFQKSFPDNVAPAQGFTLGYITASALKASTTAQFIGPVIFPVRMRAIPTATFYNPVNANAQVYNLTHGEDCSATAVAANGGDTSMTVDYTGSAATAVGDRMVLHYTLAAEL